MENSEEKDDKDAKNGKSGSKKKLLIIVGSIVLTLILINAAIIFMFKGKSETPAVDEHKSEVEKNEKKDDKKSEDKKSEHKKEENKNEKGEVIQDLYFQIKPPFTVNIGSASNKSKFLQVTVDLMTRDPKILEELGKHSSRIKNDLVILFSGKTYEELITKEGRDNLRKEALVTVQAIMLDVSGDKGVEQVFFTSFVTQ